MKTLILPLDSRPCTYSFVHELAKINSHEIVAPPIEIMDDFKKPSSYEAISSWLGVGAHDCSAAVISVDQLLYGGLLASRQSGIDLSEGLSRLNYIETLKKDHPKLKIYAFTVLMRTTISTLNMESKVWWEAVSEYSKYAYLAEHDRSDVSLQNKVKKLKEQIPKSVLDEFISVRERNHEVNKKCIKMVSAGIIEHLIVLQEDCTEAGIHKTEQEKLSAIIKSCEIESKVSLHNGTDEAVTELFSHAVSPKSTPLQIKWLGKNPDFVALFEDRPFSQNLKSHMDATKLYEDKNAKDILYIYLPKNKQKDFCTDADEVPIAGYDSDELKAFVRQISESVEQGLNVYLLDVAFSNGGDYELLKLLSEQISLRKLCGYSAWNTASNALGTVLSQIILSEGCNNRQNEKFTVSRILDDVIYQGIIRKRLNASLILKGQDPWNVEYMIIAKNTLKYELEQVESQIEELTGDYPFKFDFSFRWSRTFEIDITVSD